MGQELKFYNADGLIGAVCVDDFGRCGADTDKLDWIAELGNMAFHAGPAPWQPALAAIAATAESMGWSIRADGTFPDTTPPEGAAA